MKKTTATVPPWLRSAESGEGLFSTLGATSQQPPASALAGQVACREISFTAGDELATGRLYEPADDGVAGSVTNLVVVLHGNGEDACAYPLEMKLLAAEAGAVVLTLDQRSAASEWKPGEFNISAAISDVLAGVAWCQEQNPALATVVLWSWSQGSLAGGLALAQAAPGTFAGWVSAMAIDDAEWFWTQLHSLVPAGIALPPPLQQLVAQVEREAGGTPAAVPAAYRQRSLYASDVTQRLRDMPVVLLHGTQDQRVPFSRGLKLWDAIKGGQTGFYEVRAGRDENGDVIPAGHTRNDRNPAETRLGPVWWESRSVIMRLLSGQEKTAGDPYTVIEVREARGPAR